jgi:hypothetical protein
MLFFVSQGSFFWVNGGIHLKNSRRITEKSAQMGNYNNFKQALTKKKLSVSLSDTYVRQKNRAANIGKRSLPPNNMLELSRKGPVDTTPLPSVKKTPIHRNSCSALILSSQFCTFLCPPLAPGSPPSPCIRPRRGNCRCRPPVLQGHRSFQF